MLIRVGFPHKSLQLQRAIGVGLAEQLAKKVPNVVVTEGPRSSMGRTEDSVKWFVLEVNNLIAGA